MSFDVFNPWMLVGLAGISLPVLAHLLSRKKYDVVDWGAMQFLELGRRTRRKIRLEEFLLLLLRIGLISVVALALSRPWASGGFFSSLLSSQGRDVILVIDGSHSMSRQDGNQTPHANAIQAAQDFLDTLRPGDTVALYDARDQLRPVITPPTRDLNSVRTALEQLPKPGGTSFLASAASDGVQALASTSNLAREVVLFTDMQAKCWATNDDVLWRRFGDLLDQPKVRPRVFTMDVSETKDEPDSNYYVGKTKISRELTVAEFPLRISAQIHRTGGVTAETRRVYLEIDGQRLGEQTQKHTIQPNGEVSVEFDYRFDSTGSHLISVVIDDDDLPGDNRSDVAVAVTKALPVLLVDGDFADDPTQRETFFARAALSATDNEHPWVQATVVRAENFSSDDLRDKSVIVLANVWPMTDAQITSVREFVESGGGVLFALGDQFEVDAANNQLFRDGASLLPASLQAIHDDVDSENGVSLDNDSLSLPWVERFQTRFDGGLTDVRFKNWWHVFPARETQLTDKTRTPRPEHGAAVVDARLSTGEPFIVSRRFGRGQTMLVTSALDADWSTMPARRDFVPLLHEMLFRLAAGQSRRNVNAGDALLLSVPPDYSFRTNAFFGPNELQLEVERSGDELRPVAQLSDTQLPGVYRLGAINDQARTAPDYFVVDYDRSESDLARLTDDETDFLEDNNRMTFVSDLGELREAMFADESRTEFWHLLMLCFLGMLVFELLMTRRLVRGGHIALEDCVPADNHAAGLDPDNQRAELVSDHA